MCRRRVEQEISEKEPERYNKVLDKLVRHEMDKKAMEMQQRRAKEMRKKLAC